MSTSNPVFFIFDCITESASVLDSFSFWSVSILMWYIGFIIVNMVVSVFWRGARG